MTTADARTICKKVFDLPESNFREFPRAIYIAETFMGKKDEFCEFMGYIKAELSTIKMRRDKAISIMEDIATAALWIGEKDGFDDALRSYGRQEFQFLLGDKKQGVVA